MTRSASPSKARPRSARSATTTRASSLGSVEPQLSLMFAPSGTSCSAVTAAPPAAHTLGPAGVDADATDVETGRAAGRAVRVGEEGVELALDLCLDVDRQLRPEQA